MIILPKQVKVTKKPRLISEEPVISNMLKSWQPILPRPFRDIWLGWFEDVEATLRSREFLVGSISSMVFSQIVSKLLSFVMGER